MLRERLREPFSMSRDCLFSEQLRFVLCSYCGIQQESVTRVPSLSNIGVPVSKSYQLDGDTTGYRSVTVIIGQQSAHELIHLKKLYLRSRNHADTLLATRHYARRIIYFVCIPPQVHTAAFRTRDYAVRCRKGPQLFHFVYPLAAAPTMRSTPSKAYRPIK